MRGFIAGWLGLLAIHALVARANQAQLSGLVSTANNVIAHFLDPSIPGIPDRASSAADTATAKGGVGGTAGAAAVASSSLLYPAATAR